MCGIVGMLHNQVNKENLKINIIIIIPINDIKLFSKIISMNVNDKRVRIVF